MTAVALVTGASRGIGAAIAEELAARGNAILLNYRADEAGARAVKARIEAAGGTATLLPFDVTDAATTAAALAPWSEGDHALDVVVNNAGVARDAAFPAMTLPEWELVTRTTLDGFFNVTRPLIMPLVRRRRGRIINIASLSGLVGNRGQVNYSAAKAGLIGATRSLAQELAKRHITVNAVAPGLIDTEMLKDLPLDEVTKRIPMRRLGRAAEVAKLVAFLASDDAAYITGQVIGINGGLA
ncbi:MAG TPA: 3-oxoacyl-ACP reductase FabG [Polyangia bacterium]|nr:3-oxoacyl-ACP reductase FabG [Polyangia bacterium]